LVHAVHIDRPGRGGALRTIWTGSDADIYAYMDVDLSTDLNALLPLVAPLLSGHSDVAIGTRLARGARVIRGPKREIISRCYNVLLHASLGTRFSDAQCGFKAVRADAARVLLPLTTDTGWFFDTELLVLAERAGLRIHEVPVDWIDDADSRVKVMATALGDLRGIVRLGTGLARGTISVPALRSADLRPRGDEPGHGTGFGTRRRAELSTGRSAELSTSRCAGLHDRRLASQLTRFVLVGVASTVAYVLLYLLLRGVLPAQAANALSLLLTAMANTAVNRRVTFGIRGRTDAARHQVRGLIAFAIGLALTSGALAALHASAPAAGRAAELTVLVAANLTATLVRFGLYRSWVFRHPTSSTRTSCPESDPR
jgi:putative flippase GtrA